MAKGAGGGRPRKELEDIKFDGWQQLDALIIWASEQYCAEQLGMHIETLANKIKERYGLSFPEYKRKRQEPMRINLLKKQYDVAMSGNVSMLIWLGKQYLGQADKVEVEEQYELITDFTKDETNSNKK